MLSWVEMSSKAHAMIIIELDQMKTCISVTYCVEASVVVNMYPDMPSQIWFLFGVGC